MGLPVTFAHPARTDPARLGRWTRWTPLIAAAVTSIVLVTTAWLSYGSVREASRLLARGQGEVLLEEVRRELQALGRTAELGDIVRIRDGALPRGLRYIQLVTQERRLEAGDRSGPAAQESTTSRAGSFDITEIGERVRLAAYSRTRKLKLHAPAGPGIPEPPRPPPDLYLEFEPVVANSLAQRAQVSLATSLAAALLLLAGAFVATRWLAARDREQQVRQRERQLASVGALSAVLAHEIRNPLASLKGNAQLLAETLAGGSHQPRADRVVGEAVRLEQLATGLLDFVRSGEIHRVATAPAAVLAAAAAEVGGAIDSDISAAPATWSLDPERLQQVLSNVLRNAVQASPPGGRVEARVWADGGVLRVRVRDHGPGIPPGQEEQVFEPFHTSKTRGTGLGLAVARWVVDLHGGTIRAGNHPDGGAVIDIAIPS